MSLSDEAQRAWSELKKELPAKPRVDTYKIMMRGICGRDDWQNGVRPLTPDEQAERDRIRGFIDAEENASFCMDAGRRIDMNGKSYSLRQLKEWQRRTCYDLLASGLYEGDVAARTHLTMADVDAIKQEFNF